MSDTYNTPTAVLSGAIPSGADNAALSSVVNTPTAQPLMGAPNVTYPSQPVQNDATLTAINQSPIPQPREGQPSIWQRVLMGALTGLAGSAGAHSFGGGLAGGAAGSLAYQQQQKENAMRQQQVANQTAETQSNIRFQGAQAASLAIDAAMKDAQLHALPEQLRDAHIANSVGVMKELDALGIRPTLQFPNTNEGASAAANQLTASHNGVPPLFSLNLGDQVLTYDLNGLSQAPQGLQLINQVSSIQGKPQIDSTMWNKMTVATRTDLMNKALNFWDPVPTKENAAILAQQYQNNYDTYKKDPNADPQILTRLKTITDNLVKTQQGLDTHELHMAGAKTAAEASARQPFELAKAKADEALKDGDPTAAAQLLINGDVAPSQLISTRKPAFAQQAFTIAKTLNPTWNAQKAEAQYKYASNPLTQSTLNMISAMQEKGGSLEIAKKAFDDIPLKISDQDFNKIVNGTLAKFGGKSIVKFRTAMLGLADEYSKVMGGGQPSDTGRQQALDLIREAYSKGQGAAAVDTIKQDIAARKRAMVRDNPVLMKLYPDETPAPTAIPTAKKNFFEQHGGKADTQ
jgi:hypothetical protein